MQFFLFMALIITMILLLFAVQNSEVITLTFVNRAFKGSVAFILAIVFAGGMLTGIFISIPAWWRKVRQGRSHKKRIQELEEELSSAEAQTHVSEHVVEDEY